MGVKGLTPENRIMEVAIVIRTTQHPESVKRIRNILDELSDIFHGYETQSWLSEDGYYTQYVVRAESTAHARQYFEKTLKRIEGIYAVREAQVIIFSQDFWQSM